MTNGTVTFIDYSGEKSSAGYYLPDLSGSDYASIRTIVDQINGAVAALSRGNQVSFSWTAERIQQPIVLPGNPDAQREIKALVTYSDNVTGQRYSMTIPVFGMDGAQQGTDVLDLTAGGWPSFVSVFEAGAVSINGNPVTVEQAVIVGRAS